MNWASTKAGAMLVDFSTELDGCPASNVLDDNLSTIWLSEEGFPQWLCISLTNLHYMNNLVIRTVGWNCWHSYITNPRIVSMHVSSDGAKFKVWDSFEVSQRTRGTQLFSCAPVDTAMYPYIALEVTQTFGGAQTYMNRVFLYADEVTASPTSSKDGQSTISEADSEKSQMSFVNSHSNNVSELSARTPEREHAGRVSHDTEQLVEQLQDALGLRTVLEDSYYSDDLDNGLVQADVHLPDASPATVAGRLASLEHTVHALEHTLLDQYSKANGTVSGVSFARSPTPPSRVHSRSQSPATSQGGRSRKGSSSATNTNYIDEQRVAVVTDRINSIEEKFTRLLDKLETSWSAPSARSETPLRPPPPPPPPPARSYSPERSLAHSTTQHSITRAASLRSDPPLPQRLDHSATSFSNATISTKSPSLMAHRNSPPRDSYRPTHSSPARAGLDGTERVMEQVVRSVETMMHRVLAQHETKHRVTSMDSTINSSSAFEPAEVNPLEFWRRHKESREISRQGSGSRSRSASRSRSSRRRSNSPDRGASSSSDRRHPRSEKPSRVGRGLGSYISSNAERLLLEKKQREQAVQRDEDITSQRRRPSSIAHISHNRIRAAMQERSHTRIESGTAPAVDSSSEDGSPTGKLQPRKFSGQRSDLNDQESHNILERSIFELLKSKYGIGVPDTARSRDDHSIKGAASSLPMRVPVQPSVTDMAVVDWSQYLKNRIACVDGSRHGSPLRGSYTVGGVVINGDENTDVLPRARQSARDSRRERDHQQAAARDQSVSPLRESTHADVMKISSAHAVSLGSLGDGSTAAPLPAWCNNDAEMAQLVRALHEKVYQRTVKEAQYDMLLSAQR